MTLASDANEARALARLETDHVELSAGLALHVEAVTRAARASDGAGLVAARNSLVAWCRQELEAHTAAEEAALYPVARARPELELLVRALSHEHGLLVSLVARVGATTEAVALVEASGALRTLFESHVAKENELVLPVLAAQRATSLAGVLEAMQAHADASGTSDRLPEPPESSPLGDDASTGETVGPHGDGSTCGCHEVDGDGYPELDARVVPHAIRHATVFGALDAVRDGGGLVLIAPHDPLPLLAQIGQRHPDVFDVRYLARGPEAWRLLFERRAS